VPEIYYISIFRNGKYGYRPGYNSYRYKPTDTNTATGIGF